jgi:hypothetical protein
VAVLADDHEETQDEYNNDFSIFLGGGGNSNRKMKKNANSKQGSSSRGGVAAGGKNKKKTETAGGGGASASSVGLGRAKDVVAVRSDNTRQQQQANSLSVGTTLGLGQKGGRLSQAAAKVAAANRKMDWVQVRVRRLHADVRHPLPISSYEPTPLTSHHRHHYHQHHQPIRSVT